MSLALIHALTGAGLIAVGLHAVVVHAHLLRKIIAVNVLGSGVFLVLVAMAQRTPDGTTDPVPQAMVITGIVVAVSATALALVLLLRLNAETRHPVLPEELSD